MKSRPVAPKNTARAKLGRTPDRPRKKIFRHPSLRQDVEMKPGEASQTHLDPRIKNPGSKPRHNPGPETMCWAKKRGWTPENNRRCRNAKGFKTAHVGEGRCWLHGGNVPIKHGLDSMVKHGRLKDLIKQMQDCEMDIMDLKPEATLLRAMVIDFVNRYDDFVDQLATWYNAIDTHNKDIGLPPVPRRYPALEDAGQLIEAISRIVERIHKMQKEGSITLDVFRSVMTQMGLVVAKHVESEEVLKKIEFDWGNLLVEPKSSVRGGTYAQAQQLDEGDDEQD